MWRRSRPSAPIDRLTLLNRIECAVFAVVYFLTEVPLLPDVVAT